MTDMNVRFVKLEPMRVASVCVTSEAPERDAWEKLRAWAEPAGLLEDLSQHAIFGFNNPGPRPGDKQYGYEFWICVDPDVESSDDIKVKRVEGGLYAVTTCESLDVVGQTWQRLWDYVKSPRCSYEWRQSQELEKPHNPRLPASQIVLDLYLPVVERCSKRRKAAAKRPA